MNRTLASTTVLFIGVSLASGQDVDSGSFFQSFRLEARSPAAGQHELGSGLVFSLARNDSANPTGRPSGPARFQEHAADAGQVLDGSPADQTEEHTTATRQSEWKRLEISDDWNFMLAPYLWATAVSSDVQLGPIRHSSTLDFGEVLDHFDMGWMLYAEARKGRWGLSLDTLYMNLGFNEHILGKVPINAHLEQLMFQLNGFYRFGDAPRVFDFMMGARYFNTEVKVDFGPFSPSPHFDYFEPVVGFRFIEGLSPKWAVTVRGDVGGFGIGDASKFTWQIAALLDYRINRNCSLSFGYRLYVIDYHHSDFVLHEKLYGPIIGLVFSF